MKKLLEKLESLVEIKLVEIDQTKAIYAGSEYEDTSTSYDSSTAWDHSTSYDYSQRYD